MKNRRARRLVAILSVVVLSALVALVTSYSHRWVGPHPIVRFLKPSDRGFGKSNFLFVAGKATLYSGRRYQCGFFVVYVEQPWPAVSRKISTVELKSLFDALDR
jgi:hypothetical protein